MNIYLINNFLWIHVITDKNHQWKQQHLINKNYRNFKHTQNTVMRQTQKHKGTNSDLFNWRVILPSLTLTTLGCWRVDIILISLRILLRSCSSRIFDFLMYFIATWNKEKAYFQIKDFNIPHFQNNIAKALESGIVV